MKKFYALFILVAILVTVFVIYEIDNSAKYDGSFEVILRNENNILVDQKTVYFKTGDNMIDILNENFDLEYDVYSFGVMITKIGEIQQDPDHNMYILFYVNNILSEVGINNVVPEDGITIEFIIIIEFVIV